MDRPKGFVSRVAIAGLVATLSLALLAGSAFAAKGGGGNGTTGGGKHGGGGTTGTSSVTLVMVVDNNGNGLPNWDDTITFNVSTTQTAYPYLTVNCYQSGTLVYSANAGFYPSYPWPGSQIMPLYSPMWTGGAATCTAVLNSNLYTLNFDVGA